MTNIKDTVAKDLWVIAILGAVEAAAPEKGKQRHLRNKYGNIWKQGTCDTYLVDFNSNH